MHTRLPCSSGRGQEHQLKSSSPVKERMKVPAGALEESWFWEALLRLLLACPFTAGLIGQWLGVQGGGAAHSGPCMAGSAKRTKAAHRNGFSFLFLSFP